MVGGSVVAAGIAALFIFSGGSKKPGPAPAAHREETSKPNPAPKAPTPEIAKPAQPTSAETILEMADKQLEEAKALYEEGRTRGSIGLLNDAGFKVEEARTKFLVVQEVLEGSQRDRAAKQAVIAVQLSRLINDAKKSAAAPSPAPTPVPEPPAPRPVEVKAPPAPVPVPSPKPEKTELLAAVQSTRALLAKLAADEKVDAAAARSILARTPDWDERLAAAACLLTRWEQDATTVDRAALKSYLDKFDWLKFDELTEARHHEAIALLEAERARSSGSALVFLQLAHVNRLLKQGPATPIHARWGSALGVAIVTTPKGQKLATAAAVTISAARKKEPELWDALSELKKGPAGDACIAWYRSTLELAEFGALDVEGKKKALSEVAKTFRDLKAPDAYKNLSKFIAEVLKQLTPCRRCNGDGSTKCPTCEAGEANFVCNQCAGWGGRDRNPCRACRGAGGNCRTCDGKAFVFTYPCQSCNGRGRWKDECVKCKGSGKQDCTQCKAPWVEPKLSDLVQVSPCALCGGSGFPFDRVLSCCPACAGVGNVFKEPSRK